MFNTTEEVRAPNPRQIRRVQCVNESVEQTRAIVACTLLGIGSSPENFGSLGAGW